MEKKYPKKPKIQILLLGSEYGGVFLCVLTNTEYFCIYNNIHAAYVSVGESGKEGKIFHEYI